MGVLVLAVFGMSLYQVWLVNFSPEPSTFIGVPAMNGSLPRDDNRGVFLQLIPGADTRFPSSLVQLLETTEADVVPAEAALHISATVPLAIVVNQVVISDPKDYLVTRPGQPDPYELEYQEMPNGKILLITPKGGHWLPGLHQVDVPSGGMFDNSRLYYTFVIDEEKTQ